MKIILLFLALQLHFGVFAQNFTVDDPDAGLSPVEKELVRLKRLKYTTNKIGVTVKAPSKFTELKRHMPNPFWTSVFHYVFINKDSSMLVSVSLMPRDSAEYKRFDRFKKMYFPNWDYKPNDQWIINFKAEVDSAVVKPLIFGKETLKKFNADGGAVYKVKEPDSLFLRKYAPERSIIINRDLRGIAEIHYFKIPDKKINIQKLIDKAPEMIRYN